MSLLNLTSHMNYCWTYLNFCIHNFLSYSENVFSYLHFSNNDNLVQMLLFNFCKG